MDVNSFDPGASLSPDDPLQAWLRDPAMVDFVKQKALEHAQGVLGYSDATASSDPEAAGGAPTRMYPQETQAWRDSIPLPASPLPIPSPANVPVPSVAAPSPLDPVTENVPLPIPRPAEAPGGASDVSASAKKKLSVEDGVGDLAKTLSALKPLQPPPVNPVGTPSVRSPSAINAPAVQNLLQLLGAQGKPDPVTTLGRLLVAGKA